MTPLKSLLSLLGLLMLLASEPVLAGRRRRGGRRGRKAKCTQARAYTTQVKKMKKGESDKQSDITAGSEDAAINACFAKCEDSDIKPLFFEVTSLEKENSYGCRCMKGKLKKTKNSNFKVFTGGMDLDSSNLLMNKGKKYLSNVEACPTTLSPTTSPSSSPTEEPTKSPTKAPTGAPTKSPTKSPSASPTAAETTSEQLFKVVAGGAYDASDMFTGRSCPRPDGWCSHDGAKYELKDCDGDGIPDPVCSDSKHFGVRQSNAGCKDTWPTGKCVTTGNMRSNKINNLAAQPFQELRVSVMADNKEQAFFCFANVGGEKGWFTYDNMVASSYVDLTSKPEFFRYDAWDEKDRPAWVQKNWSGNPIQGNSFSEENGGFSEIKDLPLVGMKCEGGNCDNKRLRWTNSYGGIVDTNSAKFIKQISEESPNNNMRCPANQLVCRIQCTGGNCDNLRVHCCAVKSGWRVNGGEVAYSGWFSEENGGTRDCGRDRYVAGLKCRGGWCDDVELICLKLEHYDHSIGRDFYVTKSHGGCDKDNGWLAVDSGKSGDDWDPCSWENQKGLAIYYAKGDKSVNPYQGKVSLAQSMTVSGVTYRSGYIMAYKIGTNTNQMNLWENWTKGGAIGMDDEAAMAPANPNKNYRAPLLDIFMKRNQAGKAMIQLYKGGKVVKAIEFMVNPGDASSSAWMTPSNILKSDWAGVKPGMTNNFFSVAGDAGGNRRFFIQNNYGGCEVDSGWLVVQTMRRASMCPWESNGKQPLIYYSAGDANVKWQTAGAYAEADTLVVSVSFDKAIKYTRKAKGCVNGGNISKTTLKTVAECAKLCDANAACKAFEYGVAYGGGGAYKAFDCQLNNSANSADCDGGHHNLDLYTKM